MRATKLCEEHQRALLATRFSDLMPLVDAGVGWDTIALVTPAHCSIVVEGSLYQPDPNGGAAFLMPVRVGTPITPEALDPTNALQDGAIVDLVAFHPARPDCWALRHGNAEWLGAIEPQYLEPAPVRVWRSPLRWLQAGCCGLVALSDQPESRYRVLSNLQSVVAENDEHAVELRTLLNHSWSGPRVIVTREADRAA